MYTLIKNIVVVLLVALVSGCASSGSSTYSLNDAREREARSFAISKQFMKDACGDDAVPSGYDTIHHGEFTLEASGKSNREGNSYSMSCSSRAPRYTTKRNKPAKPKE